MLFRFLYLESFLVSFQDGIGRLCLEGVLARLEENPSVCRKTDFGGGHFFEIQFGHQGSFDFWT